MTLIAKTYWGGAPWAFSRPPPDGHGESRVLRSEDFRDVPAMWWTSRGEPRPRVAFVAMHPRVDFRHHYAFPRLLSAGFGCLGLASRNLNDDTDAVHEDLLLDLAAGVRWLREHRGVERVVLLGNSGGGSLGAFYQAQARLDPEQRIRETPAGEPTRLGTATMIPADALVLVAAHPGQGRVLGACIDPSLTDERDPLSVDGSLDMYHPDNGFRPPPEWSEYGDDFLARYRDAQRVRVARIDFVAREYASAAREAAQRIGAESFDALPEAEQRRVRRRAAFEPVMVVYRTMANPAYTDRRIHPSPREYGSLLSDRPDLMNWQRLGFARTVTPRGWLSTWSGLSSNAVLAESLTEVREPLLMVHAGRDREVYRPDADVAFDRAASADKTFHELRDARHYFEPDIGASEAPHREKLMDLIVEWARERFG